MSQEIKTDLVPPATTNPVSNQSPGRMSYEEFLAWADEDTWAEWVDGEVVVLSPASDPHQNLAGFLSALFRHLAEAKQLGRIFMAPFLMKLETRPSGREPDIIFVAKRNLDRLKLNYLDGPADLVVEIVSPDSQSRDRGEKYYEYEEAGVSEYWLLDPTRKQAEFYRLGADGTYSRISVGDDDTFSSAVLEGLWLKVDWLWQEPLPTLMSVLKEWGLVKE